MRCTTSFRSRRAGDAGVSLVEILLVLVMLGLILAFTIPFSLKYLARLRVEGYATQVSSLMQSTRGRAIRDNQDRSVSWFDADGNGTIDSISGFTGLGTNNTAQVTLSLEERGLAQVLAPCLDLDSDGTDDRIVGPLTYDGQGVANGLVAFCFEDPSGNLLQVAVDTPSGPPKIRKQIASGDFVTERWKWEWY